jgi:hypothetical protein
MTEADWQIIERIAKIYGFTIHPAEPEFEICRKITNKADASRSDFWWQETEGFDAFFEQVHEYAYECGYQTGARY